MKRVILAAVLLLITLPAAASLSIWSITGPVLVQIGSAPPIAAPMSTEVSVFSSKDACDTARASMLSGLVIKRATSKTYGIMQDYSTWLPVANVVITDLTTCVPSVQY